MRPAAFDYSRPASLPDALRAMQAGAQPLAGGQSLLPAMRLRQQAPTALVDLCNVLDLANTIDVTATTLTIGARVVHAQMLEDVTIAREFSWLKQAAYLLGDVQVRNRGTVVGNVCWADPRANFAVAMLASDALVGFCSPALPTRVQTLPIDEFFVGFRQHRLDGCLVTHLSLPRGAARGVYREFSRQPQDLALVNVCVVRYAQAWRIAVGGIHQTPLRLSALETRFATALPDDKTCEALISQALRESPTTPLNDPYGSADYKLHLAQVELCRALRTFADGDNA